jgi:malonyl-CoA O-methyltransferase
LPEPRAWPEKRAVRRAFERAAADYDRHAVLQREVGGRLAQHLDPIRIEPRTVVDLGCGTGEALAELSRRFPGARLVAIDLARAMLDRARARTPAWKRLLGSRAPALVCADVERLPLAGGSAQLAWSNLTLQWCRPEAVFGEVSRVLEPGGLFLFSTFGPDTLKELRAAFAAVDDHPHVSPFVDMHDLGDALVHAGLAEPVMEMEVLTLEYASVEAVARDLKAIGAANAMPGRHRGLSGRGRWRRMVERYERERRGEVLPATYEVVYGHAWKTAPRKLADGRQVIDFRPREAR